MQHTDKRPFGVARSRLWLSAAAAVLGVAAAGVAPAQGQDERVETRSISIESGALSAALVELSRETGVPIFAPSDLTAGRAAPPVDGELTVMDAVAALLEGSGLYAFADESGAIIIRSAQSEDAAAVAAPTAASGGPAIADAIIVTARKRRTSIVDVSGAISVLSGELLEDRGVTEFDDLVNQTPGMSFRRNYGSRISPTIVIRGVGLDDSRPNGSPSAAVHVDGVYQGSNAFLASQIFDIDRVEVLKGPQGTLYGRNTTAGVVNLISRAPSDAWEGRASVQYASFDTRRVDGAVGGAVTDALRVRLAAVYEKGDGYQTNLGTGFYAGYAPAPGVPPIPEVAENDHWGGTDFFAARATLLADLGPRSTLDVKLFGARDESEQLLPDLLGTSFGFTEPDDDPRTVYSNLEPSVDADIYGGSATLTHDFADDLTLTAVAARQIADRTAGYNEGTPLRIGDAFYSDEIRQTTFEARLADAPGGTLDWIVGVFYLDDDIDFSSDLSSEEFTRSQVGTRYLQTRRSIAAFVQTDWRLAPAWSLGAGARFTHEEADFSGATIDLDPYGVSIAQNFAPYPVVFDNSFEDDSPSGRVSLTYAPDDAFSAYVAASRGFKSGGFDGTTIFSPEEAQAFGSESVWSYEAGVKYYPRGRGVELSADVFWYDFEDLQATAAKSLTPGAPPTNVRTNVAEARVGGLELAGRWTAFDGARDTLSLSAGISLLDSEIVDVVSDDPVEYARRVGNVLPDAPDVSANWSVEYSHAFGDSLARAVLDGRYVDETYKEIDNFAALDAYSLVNARVGLSWREERYEVAIFGRNITDEVYFDSFSPSESGQGWRIAGPPATWGVELSARF